MFCVPSQLNCAFNVIHHVFYLSIYLAINKRKKWTANNLPRAETQMDTLVVDVFKRFLIFSRRIGLQVGQKYFYHVSQGFFVLFIFFWAKKMLGLNTYFEQRKCLAETSTILILNCIACEGWCLFNFILMHLLKFYSMEEEVYSRNNIVRLGVFFLCVWY